MNTFLAYQEALGKLTLYVEILSVKQNLDLVWFLESQALGKLTLYVEDLSVKQNLGLVQLLRSQALGKINNSRKNF